MENYKILREISDELIVEFCGEKVGDLIIMDYEEFLEGHNPKLGEKKIYSNYLKYIDNIKNETEKEKDEFLESLCTTNDILRCFDFERFRTYCIKYDEFVEIVRILVSKFLYYEENCSHVEYNKKCKICKYKRMKRNIKILLYASKIFTINYKYKKRGLTKENKKIYEKKYFRKIKLVINDQKMYYLNKIEIKKIISGIDNFGLIDLKDFYIKTNTYERIYED